jgi:hypothetical protein
LSEALKWKMHPLILWGVGTNDHGSHLVQWPEWVKEFDLIGLRDYLSPWDYTPCPTCMSAFFDHARIQEEKHEVVIYEHPICPIPNLGPFPRTTNKHKADEFPEVLMFLGSGKTIITSTYHGTYWGMLLGKKVLCWKPWSSKFFGLEPHHYRVNEQNWKKVHEEYPLPVGVHDFLMKCREANIDFAKKVFDLLDA